MQSRLVAVTLCVLAVAVVPGCGGGRYATPAGEPQEGYVAQEMDLCCEMLPPPAPTGEGRPAFNTEAYDRIVDNPFLAVQDNPLSTFSIDVDTASYSNVRRFLNQGRLPPPDAVRIEELVNYFRYQYEPPSPDQPFSVSSEVATCPWQSEYRLLHIGIMGRPIAEQDLPPRNLVFLLDVSGSMESPDKLPLLKDGMRLLVEQLGEDDRVAIAVYAGAAGQVLPPTPGSDRATILEAIGRLDAGGSTNGGEGIRLAYAMAEESLVEGGVNRVILATDGDFNVGTTNQGELVRLIEDQRESGIFLTVLGFGTGNLKDSTMEQLADKGNGNYAYIDSILEARKVLVEEAGATLVTIAKDVKLQLEFNPQEVAAYRLIGYENRLLRNEDFNDDTKDAGEIGAGHTVTALYELVPAGLEHDSAGVDELRYQEERQPSSAALSGELVTVKIRYKAPDGDTSQLLSFPVVDDGAGLQAESEDFLFSAAVASFGMLLRGSEHAGSSSYEHVLELAEAAAAHDPGGLRREFVTLVEAARRLAAAEPQTG